MIVSKRSNFAAGYEVAEGQGKALASNAGNASGRTESVNALVSLDKPLLHAILRVNRPDASFVTHLIAAAEHMPQARTLRRAAIADAMSCYAATVKVASPGSHTPITSLSRVV